MSDGFNEILARYHAVKDEDERWFQVCTEKFGIGVSPTEEELTNWEKFGEALLAVKTELHEYVV